jgi:hypothetical protein
MGGTGGGYNSRGGLPEHRLLPKKHRSEIDQMLNLAQHGLELIQESRWGSNGFSDRWEVLRPAAVGQY